jgi:predicted aspartyl protease
MKKSLLSLCKRPAAVLAVAAVFCSTGIAQEAAAFRRFATKDGKTFHAAVTARTGTSVSFKLENGKPLTLRLTDLSDPDQQFLLRWTKFKDELMNNVEFARVTVKEMLELTGYQSFEFDIRGNHIFVEAEVGGKPMNLMVDTGAQSSVLHVEAAKEAGLNVGPFDQEIYGVAGKTKAAVTSGVNIKLGDVKVENRKLLAANLSEAGMDPKEAGGILGADFLREMDAVISYREGRMFLKPKGKADPAAKPGANAKVAAEFRRWSKADGTSFVAALDDKNEKEAIFRFNTGQTAPLPLEKLSESDRDVVAKWSKLRDNLAKNPEFATLTVKELLELRKWQSFKYRLSGNHILVDGSVGDTKATFLIDTGAFSGVFHIEFTQKAKLEMGPMDQEIRGIGGTAPAAITKCPILKMGDAVITNREMLSADLFKFSGGFGKNHDGIFGADFLRQLDGLISYKDGLMFLRPENSDKADESKDKPAEGKTEGAKPADAKEKP